MFPLFAVKVNPAKPVENPVTFRSVYEHVRDVFRVKQPRSRSCRSAMFDFLFVVSW